MSAWTDPNALPGAGDGDDDGAADDDSDDGLAPSGGALSCLRLPRFFSKVSVPQRPRLSMKSIGRRKSTSDRNSARASIRLGGIGTPGEGDDLSMAEKARQSRVQLAAVLGVAPLTQDTNEGKYELSERFRKLRALRERASNKALLGADDEDDDDENEDGGMAEGDDDENEDGGPAEDEDENEDDGVQAKEPTKKAALDTAQEIDLETMAAAALATVNSDASMLEYAEEFFSRSPVGLLGCAKPPALTAQLSHSATLRSSLHELSDPSYVAGVLGAFHNIQRYMGDRPSRNRSNKAAKVFKATVQCPEELRDEVLCQLIKQTTNNPSAASCVRGWELMAMCTGLFPPSAKLEPYLLAYMRRTVEDEPYPGVGKLAIYALLRASKTVEVGPRREPPSKAEMVAVRSISPVALRVHMLDGGILALEAESWTTVGDLNLALAERLGIKDPGPFGLCEVNDQDEERVLAPGERALDVISYWETDKRVARRSKDAPTFWLVYKVRLFVQMDVADDAAMQLAFHQAVHDVTDSRYPCSQEDAFRLAALQAQEIFGDYVSGEDPFGDEMEAFLPAKYYDPSIDAELKFEVGNTYQLLAGYTAHEARANYLDYVQAWKLFGSAYFFVEPQHARAELPPTVVLAVNAKGVIAVDMHSKDLLAEYPFAEIVNWGHGNDAFVVEVGNLARHAKHTFKTDQGLEIAGLVQDYVQRLS